MNYKQILVCIYTLFLSINALAQNNIDKYVRLVDLESKNAEQPYSNAYFNYDLVTEQQIKIGPYVLTRDNLKIRIVKAEDLYEFNGEEKVDKSISEQKLLLYRFPKSIFTRPANQLEFILKYKEKTAVFKLDEQTLNELSIFKEDIKTFSGQLKKTPDTVNGKLAYNGYFLLDNDVPDVSEITFCVYEKHKDEPRLGTRACLEAVASTLPIATINSETARTIDSFKVAQGSLMSWIGINSNLRLEIDSLAPKVQIVDVLPHKKDFLMVTAAGDLPIQPVRLMTQNEQLVPETNQQNATWKTEIKKTNPWLYFRGQGGGLFGYQMVAEPDKHEHYIFLEKSDLNPTYQHQKTIHGRKSNELTLTSENGKITESKKGKMFSTFEWTVDLSQTTEAQGLILNASAPNGENKKFSVSVDRAYPGDISLRGGFTQAANSEFISVAEVTGSYWFENFLDLKSKFFHQRFGLTARYLSALAEYPTSTTGNASVSLAQTNLGLRMRTSFGIWGRDAGGGLSLEYQDFMLDSVSFPSLGVGVFWAMPLPRFLNSSMNEVPYLGYPKWLDLEFVYYPVSLKSDYSMNPTFNLNLTTKIAISNRFFGDVGLSYRSYNYQMQTAENKLSSTYFVLGLGARF